MEIDTHISFTSEQTAMASQRRGMKEFLRQTLNAKESNELKTGEQQKEKTKQQSVLYAVQLLSLLLLLFYRTY